MLMPPLPLQVAVYGVCLRNWLLVFRMGNMHVSSVCVWFEPAVEWRLIVEEYIKIAAHPH